MAALTPSGGVPRLGRSRRVSLPLFLVVSAAFHAAAVVLLPGASQRPHERVEVLEVSLARPEPPRVAAPAPVRDQPPEPRKKAPARAQKPRPTREAPPEPPIAVESRPLPQLTAPAQQPSVTPSQADTARPSAPEAPAEAPRGEAARSGPGKSESGAAERSGSVAPPSFNAAYLRNPAPRYPVSARRRGEQGTVTLKVLVTREGSPSSVSIEKTSGSAALDQAAVEAVKSWRFAPARQGEQPVEAWVLVPIVFRLDGLS